MDSSSTTDGKRITLATVARLVGVSQSTVSLVLNDRPLARNLSEETRTRIRAAARTLQYRPNAAARSLRSARTHLVGVIVFDIADPYCTLILQGAQEVLGNTSLLPIILDVQNQNARFERYLEMVIEHQVEGLIIVANWLFVDLDNLRRFEDIGIPTIIVGREFTSATVSSVLVDNEAGGAIAMDHLLALGHREIGVILGPKRLQDSERRWRGMQRAAKAVGHTIDPKLVMRLPESADPLQSFIGGHAATAELTRQNQRFTAMLAFDDLTACGVIRALHESGIQSPDDVSVVGFDDIPQAVLTTPSLTTVSQEMNAVGSFAASHILRLIQAGRGMRRPGAVIQLHPPRMVIRESTGPLKRSARSR